MRYVCFMVPQVKFCVTYEHGTLIQQIYDHTMHGLYFIFMD